MHHQWVQAMCLREIIARNQANPTSSNHPTLVQGTQERAVACYGRPPTSPSHTQRRTASQYSSLPYLNRSKLASAVSNAGRNRNPVVKNSLPRGCGTPFARGYQHQGIAVLHEIRVRGWKLCASMPLVHAGIGQLSVNRCNGPFEPRY